MKSFLAKISKLDTKIVALYTLIIAVSIFILASSSFELQGYLIILGSIFIVGLFWVFGAIVMKTAMSAISIIYIAAIYTETVITTHGNIAEPFLLTLGTAFLFLAVSYNKHNYGIRSRPLSVAIFTLTVTLFKITFILYGVSFIATELSAALITLTLIMFWIYFLNTSRKTKVIYPTIVKEETDANLTFVYFNELIDIKDKKWVGKSKKESNAWPYIYSKVIMENEKGNNVVFISLGNTSNIHDIEAVDLNKSKKIKYMYLEAKENTYLKSALESFVKEIQ